MAKYLGLLSTDMRGKIGGLVTSRGRSGTTIKAKTVPTANPSKLQLIQRGNLSGSLSAWRALTDLEQLSWGTVASGLTWTNSLAQTFTPTGLQLWTQAFINAAAFSTTPPGTATGTPGTIGPILVATITASGPSRTLTAFVQSGFPAPTWLGYMSAPIPATRQYTKTIAKALVAGAISSATDIIGGRYGARFGPIPSAPYYSAVRIVPIDPTMYWSGAVFNAAVAWP